MKAIIIIGATLMSLQFSTAATVDEKALLRQVLPLPKEIRVAQQVKINPADVIIRSRSNAGPMERQAISELTDLFKTKTGLSPSGKGFEIIIGVLNSETGQLEGCPIRQAQRLSSLPNKEQAYLIQTNGANQLLVTGLNEAGVYYGVKTLAQLMAPFMDKDAVLIPLAEVVDWPDLEQRGLWNFPKEWIPWMSGIKLNFGNLGTQMTIERDKTSPVVFDKDLMTKAHSMAFHSVPEIGHFNFWHSYKLFRGYPELAGLGDGALAGRYHAHKEGNQHRVLDAGNPIFTKLLKEWMTGLAEQGVTDLTCWLTERPACDERPAPRAIGQFVLEARACIKAWQEVRAKYPALTIRLFISTTTDERYYMILNEAPPEVKIMRACASDLQRARHLPRDLFIDPLLDYYAVQGRWIGTYDVPINANGKVETPEFKLPHRSAQRVKDYVTQLIQRQFHHGAGMMAWHKFAKEICDFNISALAEWSWNAKGRSEKDFAIAWATINGYKNPEAVAAWAEVMGPVEWDVYDSELPDTYACGNALKMIQEHKVPVLGEGMFRYYTSEADFDKKLKACEDALRLAGQIENPDFKNETLVVSAYIKLAKSIYFIAKIMTFEDIANLAVQDKLKDQLSLLEQAGKENVAAIRAWRSAYGPEPWHDRAYNAIRSTEATVSGIAQWITTRYLY